MRIATLNLVLIRPDSVGVIDLFFSLPVHALHPNFRPYVFAPIYQTAFDNMLAVFEPCSCNLEFGESLALLLSFSLKIPSCKVTALSLLLPLIYNTSFMSFGHLLHFLYPHYDIFL